MALEVAAAIIGILAAAGKVAETLGPYVSAWKHAPKNAAAVLCEVNASRVCLSALQGLLDHLDATSPGRKTLIQIDQLIATFTDGVLLFSELETIIIEINENRTKWAWKDSDLAALVSRLQCFKSSISVMLNILQCSDQEAISSGRELLSITSSLLQSNLDLSRRMAHLEDYLRKEGSIRTSRPASIATTTFHVQNATSTDMRSSNLRIYPSTGWVFEPDLIASRVYQRAKSNICDASFHSSIPVSHAWSALSDISLSDISAISVIALPVDWTEVSNAQYYKLYRIPTSNDSNELHQMVDKRYPFFPKLPALKEYRPSNQIQLIVYGKRGAGAENLISNWVGRPPTPMKYAAILKEVPIHFSKSFMIENRIVTFKIEVVFDPSSIVGSNEYIDRGKLYMFVFSVQRPDSVSYALQEIRNLYNMGIAPYSMMIVANHYPKIPAPWEIKIINRGNEQADMVGCKFYGVSRDNPHTIGSAICDLVQAKWVVEKEGY